jgi:hypothetical protein
MRVTNQFLIAALTACLITVWTCPAYCSVPSAHPAKVAASIEKTGTGHEHHHMGEMSVPLNGFALTAGHSDCCEHCGNAGQALGLGEKPSPAFTSNPLSATLTPLRPRQGFALLPIEVRSPPLLEDRFPTSPSVSPLRI